MEKGKRIQLLDAIRGFCIILMVLHHLGFDMQMFGMLPDWVLDNPVFNVVQPFFASMFMIISGVSSRFSKSNIKRGFKTLAAALLVSVVTYFMGQPILFGILHFLGCSMIIYGLAHKLIDGIPKKLAPLLWLGLWVVFRVALRGRVFDVDYLWWLGFVPTGFYSADYYPLLPWIFMFFFGTWAGGYIRDGKFPAWFYEIQVPVLPAIGRKSLWIYLLHQPVCYGLVYLIYVIRQ